MVHFPITPCFHLWETPGRGRCPPPSAPGRTRQESNLRKHLCGDNKPGTDPPHYQSTEHFNFFSGRFSFCTSNFTEFYKNQTQTKSRLKPTTSELLTKLLSAWATGSDWCALFLSYFTLLNLDTWKSIKTRTNKTFSLHGIAVSSWAGDKLLFLRGFHTLFWTSGLKITSTTQGLNPQPQTC